MTGTAWSRRALVLLAVGVAGLAIVQVSLVDFLPTPWAVPDLVAVAVLALAIARGPLAGALVGAWAGIILDLIPPSTGPLGGWMLVLVVAGAALGRVAETYQPGPFAAMGLLAVGTGVVVVARAAVLWFAGSPAAWSALGAAAASAAWALVLAPLALLLVTRSTGPARSAPGRITPAGGFGSAGGPGE